MFEHIFAGQIEAEQALLVQSDALAKVETCREEMVLLSQ
jgi:hypothetical protein